MKVYLVILNWVLASALVSCALWLAPLVGGWPLPVGMFIGCMMTAGMVSWQYYKDQSPEKEWKWRKNYFKKDYRIEIFAHHRHMVRSLVSVLAGILPAVGRILCCMDPEHPRGMVLGGHSSTLPSLKRKVCLTNSVLYIATPTITVAVSLTARRARSSSR